MRRLQAVAAHSLARRASSGSHEQMTAITMAKLSRTAATHAASAVIQATGVPSMSGRLSSSCAQVSSVMFTKLQHVRAQRVVAHASLQAVSRLTKVESAPHSALLIHCEQASLELPLAQEMSHVSAAPVQFCIAPGRP